MLSTHQMRCTDTHQQKNTNPITAITEYRLLTSCFGGVTQCDASYELW